MIENLKLEDLHLIQPLIKDIMDKHNKLYPSKIKSYKKDCLNDIIKSFIKEEEKFFLVYKENNKIEWYIMFEIQEKAENAFMFKQKNIYIYHILSHKRWLWGLFLERVIKEAKKLKISEIQAEFWDLNKDAENFFIKKNWFSYLNHSIKLNNNTK